MKLVPVSSRNLVAAGRVVVEVDNNVLHRSRNRMDVFLKKLGVNTTGEPGGASVNLSWR
jgi:hypothetical protein